MDSDLVSGHCVAYLQVRQSSISLVTLASCIALPPCSAKSPLGGSTNPAANPDSHLPTQHTHQPPPFWCVTAAASPLPLLPISLARKSTQTNKLAYCFLKHYCVLFLCVVVVVFAAKQHKMRYVRKQRALFSSFESDVPLLNSSSSLFHICSLICAKFRD